MSSRFQPSAIALWIGQRISSLRKVQHVSQEELAERAQISVSFLSMIERGRRLPRITTLAALAAGLGLTLSQMLEGIDESARRLPR